MKKLLQIAAASSLLLASSAVAQNLSDFPGAVPAKFSINVQEANFIEGDPESFALTSRTLVTFGEYPRTARAYFVIGASEVYEVPLEGYIGGVALVIADPETGEIFGDPIAYGQAASVGDVLAALFGDEPSGEPTISGTNSGGKVKLTTNMIFVFDFFGSEVPLAAALRVQIQLSETNAGMRFIFKTEQFLGDAAGEAIFTNGKIDAKGLIQGLGA